MDSGTEQLTSLRNERKPCHFWVDNEVADCYQPIVGADAIWVYCRIARNAHGAWIVSPKRRDGDTRLALREMAEWCGKSVDTVWRCLQVLELVGLLQAEHGAKSKGRYALADVKDLVTREGAQYDSGMGSFRLPAARIAELKDQVRALRLKMARKKAGGSLELLVSKGVESVAQSDRLESGLFSVPDEKCDRSVAQSDKTVAPSATASITGNYKTAKQTTTPQPPQAGACGLDLAKGGNDASKTKDCSAMGVAQVAVSGRPDDRAVSGVVGSGVPNIGIPGTRGVSRGTAEPPPGTDAIADDAAFTSEQLAHLEKHADDPEWTLKWTGYYRELNRAAAMEVESAAKAARAEAERIERLKVELSSVPAARAWVMRQCGLPESQRRRRHGIESVIEAVLALDLQAGIPLWETAPKMAEARKRFVANGEYIDVHWGPVKFYELAIWRDERGWAWNQAKLERLRGASVGSAR